MTPLDYRIVDRIHASYLETALWSSINEDRDQEPFDDSYGIYEFSADAYQESWDDCARLYRLLCENSGNGDYDDLYEFADHVQGDDHIGHDFWLTRVGHGAGFWDGDYVDHMGNDNGDIITDLVKRNFSSEYHVWEDSSSEEVYFE